MQSIKKMSVITNDIKLAAAELQKNNLVGIPTETVYGLAANAYDSIAVEKIFKLKNRPAFNPLIVHIKCITQLSEIAIEIPPIAWLLAKEFWPGPLTLVLKKKSNIPDAVTANKNTVAVRMPQHPMALDLLNHINFPLAAPSANPFGSISPTEAKHVENYFGNDLTIILDGGPCLFGIESTIIGFKNNEAILFRHGSTTLESIEQVVGKIKVSTENNKNPEAPGMLLKHYAPTTLTYLTKNVELLADSFKNKKIGLLLFKDHPVMFKNYKSEILSSSGNLAEAAQNLYAAMHRLDNSGLDLIIAELHPDEGLGKSINDKLTRAQHHK